MGYKKGRQQALGFKRETTRLTAETTGFVYVPWTSLSAKNTNGYRQDTSAFGRRGAFLTQTLVKQNGEANFSGIIDADYILYPLHMVLGTATPTTALGATTWALSVNQNLEAPTYTTVYEANDEGWKRQRGFLPTKLDLDFSVDDATYSIEGGGLIEEALGSTPTATVTEPTRYLLGRHVSISHANDQASLSGGTVLTEVKNVKVTFETGRDPSRHEVLGQLGLSNNTVDGFSAMIEFDLISQGAQSATIQGWNDNGTLRAFRIDVSATNLPVIGTSVLRPRLTLDFPASTVEVERSYELDDFVMQKVKVTVHRPDSLTATLINSIATI